MTKVHWLLQHASDVVATDEWLSPTEREAMSPRWVPKRRRDWRLGRWTAKRALARAGVRGVVESDVRSWACVSIRADESGMPRAFVADTSCGWNVSLSHSGEFGLCAIAEQCCVIGCDLEMIGRRGEEFVIDYFTAAERASVDRLDTAGERSRVVTVIWSAKESALKALGVGLRMDTRDVQVGLDTVVARPTGEAIWHPMVVCAPDRRFNGWWRVDADRVTTIVADPAPVLPVQL